MGLVVVMVLPLEVVVLELGILVDNVVEDDDEVMEGNIWMNW